MARLLHWAKRRAGMRRKTQASDTIECSLGTALPVPAGVKKGCLGEVVVGFLVIFAAEGGSGAGAERDQQAGTKLRRQAGAATQRTQRNKDRLSSAAEICRQ